MQMRPFNDEEWEDPNIPHVHLTGEEVWDPRSLDHTITDDDDWYVACENLPLPNSSYDEFGNYRDRGLEVYQTEVEEEDFEDAIEADVPMDKDSIMDRVVYHANFHRFEAPAEPTVAAAHVVKPVKRDFEALRSRFGWSTPARIVEKTFEVTTQLARMPFSTILKKRYKSSNPAMNVHRRDEPVATDQIFSDTPAIDGGEKSAQIYVGTRSMVTDVYPLKSGTDVQIANSLLDNITDRGAPTKLISDCGANIISERIKDILRTYIIQAWQSEPYHQNQNPAERRYQDIKKMVNVILQRTGAPAYTWLLCLMYVCYIMNNIWCDSINGVPLRECTGSTNDISPLLYFDFWEPVYYYDDDSDFPSESKELRGRWVGISEHCGHTLTFKILTDDTRKVIHRSNIRTALDPTTQNLRENPLNDDVKVSF